jgi:fucose permease
MASVTMIVGLLLMAVSPMWWLVIVIGFFTGLGNGMVDAGLNIYVAAHYGKREMNWLHACFGLGVTIGPLIMTAALARNYDWWGGLTAPGVVGLADYSGWRLGFVVVAVIIALLVLLIVATFRYWKPIEASTHPTEEGAGGAPVRHVTAGDTMRLPTFWLSIALFVAYVGLEIGVGQWSFTLFTEGRGIDPQTAGLWVSVYWGSFTIGRAFFGIFDHWKNVVVLRACMVGSAVGALLLWLSPLGWLEFAGLVLLGFAQAPIFPLLTLDTHKRVGSAHASNAIGFQVSAAGVGVATVPGLVGVLAQNFGLSVIAPSFLVCAILMTVLHEATLYWNVED